MLILQSFYAVMVHMRVQYLAVVLFLILPLSIVQAQCCDKMSGIKYCDSSAGRYVCQNGDYSSCYCTRHAIMDLQKFQGCCMWQGGVKKLDDRGQVLCRDGTSSEICALQIPHDSISAY